jgi:flavin reductase (DIM6/NTAB) family NADH-FMN oxidoreductase RutF
MEPARYAVWVSKANHTYRVGALADYFAVHFLSRRNRSLAELFGTLTGDDVDKFERCSWSPGPADVPLLDECTDRIIGQRTAWLDSGADHVCLMLEPIDTTHTGSTDWLTFGQVRDLVAGHPAGDRQRPRPDE